MEKAKIVTIEEGLDKGKKFQISLMPCRPAEKWALKAIAGMVQSKVEIPDNVAKQGFLGLGGLGISAVMGIKWELLEPLLDEMLTYIKYVEPTFIRPIEDEDVNTPMTLVQLRLDWFNHQLGFYMGGVPSNSQGDGGVPQIDPSQIMKMSPN